MPDEYSSFADPVSSTPQVPMASGGDSYASFADPVGSSSETPATAANVRKYVGRPYVWGGEPSSKAGSDCSGLACDYYSQKGLALPRTAREQWKSSIGERITDTSQLQPDDQLFFAGTQKNLLPTDASHTAIYLGNGKVLHESSKAGKAVIADLSSMPSQFLGAKRYPNAGVVATSGTRAETPPPEGAVQGAAVGVDASVPPAIAARNRNLAEAAQAAGMTPEEFGKQARRYGIPAATQGPQVQRLAQEAGVAAVPTGVKKRGQPSQTIQPITQEFVTDYTPSGEYDIPLGHTVTKIGGKTVKGSEGNYGPAMTGGLVKFLTDQTEIGKGLVELGEDKDAGLLGLASRIAVGGAQMLDPSDPVNALFLTGLEGLKAAQLAGAAAGATKAAQVGGKVAGATAHAVGYGMGANIVKNGVEELSKGNTNAGVADILLGAIPMAAPHVLQKFGEKIAAENPGMTPAEGLREFQRAFEGLKRTEEPSAPLQTGGEPQASTEVIQPGGTRKAGTGRSTRKGASGQEEGGGIVAQPAAVQPQVPEAEPAKAQEVAPEVTTGPHVWTSNGVDHPVTVTGDLGVGPDGRRYVSIAEGKAGVPFDEVKPVETPTPPDLPPHLVEAERAARERIAARRKAQEAPEPDLNAVAIRRINEATTPEEVNAVMNKMPSTVMDDADVVAALGEKRKTLSAEPPPGKEPWTLDNAIAENGNLTAAGSDRALFLAKKGTNPDGSPRFDLMGGKGLDTVSRQVWMKARIADINDTLKLVRGTKDEDLYSAKWAKDAARKDRTGLVRDYLAERKFLSNKLVAETPKPPAPVAKAPAGEGKAPVRKPPVVAETPKIVEPKAREPWQMTRKEYVESKRGPNIHQKAMSELTHRAYVKEAVKEGKAVPPEVLKDYPDYATPPKPEAVAGKGEVVAPKMERVSKATGMTPSQEKYLTGELQQAAHEMLQTGDNKTIKIKVPDDGQFTVHDVQGADNLHGAITGKHIPDIPVPLQGKSARKFTGPEPRTNPLLKGTRVDTEKPQYAPSIEQPSKLDQIEAAATERLQKALKGGKLSANLDPELLKDFAIVGGFKIARGVVDVAKWSAEMVKEFGDWIEPHLAAIREVAEKWHADNIEAHFSTRQPRDEAGHFDGPPEFVEPAVVPGEVAGGETPAVEAKAAQGEATAGKAEEPAPKPERKPAPVRESTGLANQVQAREAEANILSEVEATKGKTPQQWQERGKELVENDPKNPDTDFQRLAQRVANGEVELTGDRVGILLEGKRQLRLALDRARAALDAEPKNKELQEEYVAARESLDNYVRDVQEGKGRWSDVGRALQAGTTLDEGDFAQVLEEAKRVGSRVPDEAIKKLTSEVASRDERIAALEQKVRDVQADRAVQRMNREASKTASIEDIRKRREEWKRKLVKQTTSNIGVTSEQARAVYEIGRTYVEEGIVKFEDVVGKIAEDIGWKREDVIKALASRMSEVRTQSDIQKQLRELKTRAAMEQKLAGAEKGVFPPKRTKPQVSAELEELRSRYGELKNLDAVNAKIESLKKQLETGQFEKPSTEEKVVSERLENLRAERDFWAAKVRQAIRPPEGRLITAARVGASIVRGLRLGTDAGIMLRQGLVNAGRVPLDIATVLYNRMRGEKSSNVSAYNATIQALKNMTSDTAMIRYERRAAEQRAPDGRLYAAIERKAGLQTTDRLFNVEENVLGAALSRLPVIGPLLDRYQHIWINEARRSLFRPAVDAGFKPAELEEWARFINTVTGRSNAKQVPALAELILTGPRYERSRWEFVGQIAQSPFTAARAVNNRAARAKIASLGSTAATAYLVFKAAEMAGYTVSWDPDSPDFLKMRRGRETWDISAGVAPRIRDVLRLIMYAQHPSYKGNAQDVLAKAVSRPLSPFIRTPVEKISAQKQRAEGVPEDEIKSFFTGMPQDEWDKGIHAWEPLIFQAFEQTLSEEGSFPAALGASAKEFVGTNVNRYDEKQDKTAGTGPFGIIPKTPNPAADIRKMLRSARPKVPFAGSRR